MRPLWLILMGSSDEKKAIPLPSSPLCNPFPEMKIILSLMVIMGLVQLNSVSSGFLSLRLERL